MMDRVIVIVVSLLTLLVMCGLLLVAIGWAPSRLDRLEKQLGRLDDLSAKITVMHDQVAALGKLEQKLSETATAAAPLARIDSTLDDVVKKLNAATADLNDLKGRVASKNDVEVLGGKVNQVVQKLGAAPPADPEVKKIADEVAETKRLLEATRKALDDAARDIGKDVKALHLEVQKLQSQPKGGAATP